MTSIIKARTLRKHQSDAEKQLWQKLRNRQLFNLKFRRQCPIEPYIADFACLEMKLIIELDGSQHNQQIDYDQQRTEFLQKHGYRVLRYWNNEVLNNLEGVIEHIRQDLMTSEFFKK